MVANALYQGMAEESVVTQLDVLYVVLTALTLVHSVSKRGISEGLAVVAYLVLHTAAFEHVSLFLGGTHCHATSSYLPWITPCSSVNSVLFYVPWTYTSLEAARRLDFHPLVLPFAVGLLQIGFGAVYEMQGPSNGFWRWPGADGVIANASELQPWNGYPPILHEAKAHGEVATVVDGVFRVSHHAQSALTERLYGFPIFAPYFHFAFGFAWAAGLLITGSVNSSSNVSLPRLVFAGLASMLLFLPPIWITWGFSNAVGISLSIGVPVSLGVSIVPVLAVARRTNLESVDSSSADPLLFLISVIMHGFMVSFPWRAPTPTPTGLVALVSTTAVAHLSAQYVCCFGSGAATTNHKDKSN